MTHTRKKILVFSDWFLPGYKAGGPIRSLANLVHTLDYDFQIITRITDHHSTEHYAGIQPGVWTTHRTNVQVCYVAEHEMTAAFIKKILSENTFDYLYFNSLFSNRFTLMPLRVARKMGFATRCVLAPRGMLKPGALSIKTRKKKIFLFAAALLGWFKGIRWHATNEAEADEIRAHFGNGCKIGIAPNLASIVDSVNRVAEKKAGELRLICIARISSEKGIREALYFLKAAKLERVECTFYGTQQNEAYLEECISIARTISDASISFPGEIAPADIPGALKNAHFFFMPTWGENFGHAIAEALQHGKPAIISNRTPWNNLAQANAGWDLPLEESSFVEVLKHCHQMSQEEYTLWSESAKKFGADHANDPTCVRAYYSIFE